MLLAEVEPRSSTRNGSSELSRREISAMPLERRLRFCGTAAAEAWSEEPRKNLITLSATDAINDCVSENSTTLMTMRPFRLPSEYRLYRGRRRLLQSQCVE